MHKRTSDQSVCKGKARFLALVAGLLLLPAVRAPGQDEVLSPVFTDDSPEAAQWFNRAEDQIRIGNTAEALRLYQRLLDRFPNRLLADPDRPRSFRSVRAAVEGVVLSQPALLQEYIVLNEPSARRMLEEGRREAVQLTRFLTPAGLEASLDLAEMLLTRARFDFATDLLRQCEAHPLLSGPARRRWAALSILCGVYSDQPAIVTHTLEAMGEDAEAASLRSLAKSVAETFTRPLASPNVEVGARLSEATLARMGKSPTWRFDMDGSRAGSVSRRRPEWGREEPDERADAEINALLGVLPVVSSDFVYVHDGTLLTALDRFDGRPRWQADYRLGSQPQEVGRFGGMFDSISIQNDPTTVAIDQDRVAAIVSRPVADPDQRTLLVCHDAGSGRRRWLTSPAALSGELSGGTFIGAPIVYDGFVFVVVRKQTLRLASDFIAAIDLETGRRAWHQHLASAPIFGYYAVLPSTRPLAQDGSLYLSTPLGAVAAIEARSGIIRWLHVREPFGSRPRGDLTPPSHFDSMLLTPLGLVALTPSRHGIMILDPTSGEERSFRAAAAWGDPRYLVDAGTALLAVGESVVRIAYDQPDAVEPAWVKLRPDEFLTGRVAVGPEAILVPTNQRVRLIDHRGVERESVELRQLSVPIVVGGEVLLAWIDRVDSYIPFEVGEPHLRARLESNPHDPNPAISLARLAFQHRRLEALLPALDRAIDIINGDPLSEINATAQQRLFAGMLDMAPHSVLPDEVSSAIYYRLELLATTPQQRLAFLLSHGSSLAQSGRLSAAVEAYQTILTTPALSAETWSEGATARPAGDVARSRLLALAGEAGREVYRPYEDEARRELDSARGRGGAADLLLVARRYPLSTAASEACRTAARVLRAESRDQEAAAALRFGLSLAPPSPERLSVAADLLILCETTGQRFEALQLLRSIERDDPAAMLARGDGRAEPIDTWRRRLLAPLGGREPLAEIGPLGELADIKEGQLLLTPWFGRPSTRFALVRDNRNLVGYDATGAAQFIEILDSGAKDLLAVDREVALLGVAANRGQRTFEAYDMENRRSLWRSPMFEEWFEGGGAGTGALFSALSADRLFVAEETGRVGCLDRRTGAVLWGVATALDRVRSINATESFVAVSGERFASGARRSRREVESNHLLLIRPETGATITSIQTEQLSSLDLALLSDHGEVVYSSGGRLHCYDVHARAARWTIGDDLFSNPTWAGIVGSTALVFRDDGAAVSVNLDTAEVTPLPLIQPIDRSEPTPVLMAHLDRYVLKTHNGVYVLEADGSVSGLMVGAGSPGTTVLAAACATDRLIVLLAIENAARPAPRSIEIHTLDLTGRRIDAGFELDDRTEMPRPNGLQLLDGLIVVDAGRDILFLPARPGP